MPKALGVAEGIPSRAIAEGATTPNPGYNALIWSSTASKVLVWNGTAWVSFFAPFTSFTGPTANRAFTLPDANATILTDNTAVTVAQGGTGRATGTTAYSLVATGTTATGAQQTLANGLTTQVLVGGGAAALPVWTTASGSGAPVRASGPTLTTPTLTGYLESLVAIGSSGTAKTFSLTNGVVQTVTLTGNCTFTMPTNTTSTSFEVIINTGAGSFTYTFSGVKWPGNVAPTATATAARWDRLAFRGDGTNWFGSIIGQGYV